MDLLTEMRIPTRAAPRPPVNSNAAAAAAAQQRSSNNPSSKVWGNSNDLFGTSLQAPQKKKPPPRPPPPKFTTKYQTHNQEKPKKPARPTELLSNLFGRTKTTKHQQSSIIGISNTRTLTNFTSSNSQLAFPSASSKSNNHQQDGTTTSFTLIDLSPPGSPTFTTRSSSDGVSVDSFGSDGNSNPSAFTTSSGSTSQNESAFEDDFDFFGNLASGRKKQQPQQPAADPWRVSCTQGPFGSLEPPSSKPIAQQWPATATSHQFPHTREVGESNFFAFNEATSTTTTASSSASGSPFDSPSRQVHMPTIIWPNKKTTSKNKNYGSGAKLGVYQSSASSNNYGAAPKFAPAACTFEEEKSPWSDDDDETEPTGSSPPMPKQPPPPPPTECTAGLENGLLDNTERPYGIALYDFSASQFGDLDLKEGDIVYLTKLVNDNWMEGRVNSREGMFPINFVDVKVPLPGLETNVVNALYAFKAETSDDLSFKEGARIKVLSRISDDWMYGEYEGKRGQFPTSFVDKVPNDLPNHL